MRMLVVWMLTNPRVCGLSVWTVCCQCVWIHLVSECNHIHQTSGTSGGTRKKILCNWWECLRNFLSFLYSLGVPSEVDSYHSLFPLEPLLPPNRLQKTSNFSYITSCYKAVNSKDDLPYCLRRIHGAKCARNHKMHCCMEASLRHYSVSECFCRLQAGEHQVHGAGWHVEEDPAFQRRHSPWSLHHQGFWRSL